jgi:16S rRNA (adenine1518-N6/adenine1519-N6)-dimethyltransferase
MDVDLKLKFKNKPLKLVANLPYYITTPIIMKVLESGINVSIMILMVQKEVAQRFMAKPKTKEYNALSVVLQYYYEIKEELKVSRKMFYPIPNVDSVVISLKKKNTLEKIDEELFVRFVKESFSYKRKMLKNNLKTFDFNRVLAILEEQGYSEKVRAEEIKLDDYILIIKKITKTLEKVDKKVESGMI